MWTSVKTLIMDPIGHHDQNDLFSRSNELQKNLHGRPLKSYLWSQMLTTTKTTHFQGQTSQRT